jgi:hypothetical protein
LALVALGAGWLGSSATPSPADEMETIVNPLVDNTQMALMAVSQTTSPITFMLLEGWRQWGLALVDIDKTKEREAMAAAITTHALLQVDKSVRASTARAQYVLLKLKKDKEFYEDRYAGFRTPNYQPADEDEQRYFARYQRIVKVLDEHEKPVATTSAAALNAISTLRDAAAQGKFLLSSLERQNGYLMRAMQDYIGAINAAEKAAVELNETGATPRRQLRLIVTNKSPDLVFFVQIAARDGEGNYTIRDDTRFPEALPLYPAAPPEDLQIGVKGPRGVVPARVWFPVNPRDRVIIRVATMGATRDRIRFMPITGQQVQPDLNSLERKFHYLGYEAHVPAQTAPLISRWYATNETYSWQLRGGWAPGEPLPARISSSNSKELRDFGPALSTKDDQLTWELPASLQSAGDMGTLNAEVSGTAEFLKVGPTSQRQTTVNEAGKGGLSVLLEPW